MVLSISRNIGEKVYLDLGTSIEDGQIPVGATAGHEQVLRQSEIPDN